MSESKEHVVFTHNGNHTIYHQLPPVGSSINMKFAFLVVSEYFDTPDDEITRCLDICCDALNKENSA
jgi:hypothetical protein